MQWRYGRIDGREALARSLLTILRRLLLVTDGDVEQALARLDVVARRYGLWRPDFGLADFRRLLERLGEARPDGSGALALTPRGERALRRQTLEDVFAKLERAGPGEHRIPLPGGTGEPTEDTRPYAYGDAPESLDGPRTLTNWLRRTGGDAEVEEQDLEVRERESATDAGTVLCIDVSHSMTLYGEDRITPAKRVALALAELTLTKFPKDTVDVVLFGDEAEHVPLERLPYITNGPYHTNTRAGLVLAQQILMRKKTANRRIVLLTDGKPSCITDEGVLYKNPMGLDRRIVAKTLEEAARCRRRGIDVTTFMLTDDPLLKGFVERLTRACRGRCYFASSARLESFVLVDFLRNRRRRVR
jgi:uncharacterized protein with von Willebrand factor type A (vWA) domain